MVCVGLGFYVELSRTEATTFITKKISLLEKWCEDLKKDSAKVKAHIKLVMQALQQLQFLDTNKT